MSQQPKTETDRLANVIQVLQLGQKTGRLIVERSNGPQLEQGIVTLVNGQVVQASFNQLQGPEAFNQLKNWGACRFSFVPEARSGTAGRMPSLAFPATEGESTGHFAPGTSPLRNRAAATDPLRNRTPGTAPLSRSLYPSGPLPGPAHPSGPLSGPVYPQERSIHHNTTRNLGGARPPAPIAWQATPYRTRHVEEGIYLIEQMGLSRTHRRLFLLIDGGRTVKELIRLMSHDPEDVQHLLHDLERAGVIQV